METESEEHVLMLEFAENSKGKKSEMPSYVLNIFVLRSFIAELSLLKIWVSTPSCFDTSCTEEVGGEEKQFILRGN